MTAQELHVGAADELRSRDRTFVHDGRTKIGVFHVDGHFYAYENRCVHQGGPVCEGKIVGKVEAVLEEDLNVVREVHSATTKHLACPWHGYEFDLRTGRAAGDARLSLSRYDVVVREGQVFVVVG